MIIRQRFNGTFNEVFTTQARYILIWGGRGRGGSYFGTDYFLHKITQPAYFRGYFMRGVFGDIRESLWRDFKDRIEENDTVDSQLFNLQENPMVAEHLPTGNMIISKGFKKQSGTQTAKLKSIAGATHVLIEEAEEIDEMDFNQMDDSIRTTKNDIQIILIFNPPNKDHWIIKRWFNLEPAWTEDDKLFEGYYNGTPKSGTDFIAIHSTYLSNIQNINKTTILNFEAYKEKNFEYYATMVKGYISEGLKGVIYRNWKPITNEEFNALDYDRFYGLDFGYSSDPAALVEIKHHNGRIYCKELIYQTGLTNQDLALRMGDMSIAGPVYADSAEPKSIEELSRLDKNIRPSVKGADSVRAGINFLKSMEVFYVEDSTNLIKEKNNYRWATDANKEPTDRPEDKYNHLMDAIRYGVYTHLNENKASWLAF